MTRIFALMGAAVLFIGALAGGAVQPASADSNSLKNYVVVFDGGYAVDDTYAVESTYAVLCSYAVGGSYAVTGQYAVGCDYAVTPVYAVYAVAHDYAVGLVGAAGGTVRNDLLKQIGVMIVQSANPTFAEVMRGYAVVDEVASDHKWKAYPTVQEAVERGQLTVVRDGDPLPGGGPEPRGGDPLEPLQWSKRLIRAPEAHAIQAGSPLVEVGILDTGIDGEHVDFVDTDGALHAGSRVPFSNVNCDKGADFTTAGPGLGNPDPCTDNGFHGTHVAGIVAARASNETGVAGVAPNIELIPVKVCDTVGFCYSSNTVAGITYAGDMKFEVINMSFFVDDDQFMQSTEFKCMSDEQQRAFRRANERAIQYARKQGVVPVAALGNSNNDLAHPPEPYENNCEVVPAETQGVVGTMALGPTSEKSYYSNYGVGATDVAAPGGNSRNTRGEFPGPCGTQVLSTIPGDLWACLQGTSMASPHAAGVAALIVSQFGRLGTDAGEPDVVMRPQDVEAKLQSTTIDLVTVTGDLRGYDGCFGHGRIDALRAVLGETKTERQPVEAPVTSGCPTFR